MSKWVCTVCGYAYDPEVGDPDGGVAAGTAIFFVLRIYESHQPKPLPNPPLIKGGNKGSARANRSPP
mgnify:CR=1 FL=1